MEQQKGVLQWVGSLLIVFSSVQFVSASRPSTEYFIRNTGTGSIRHLFQ